MTELVSVGTAKTNAKSDSATVVELSDLLLAWEVQNNLFNDQLPIIPKTSRVLDGHVQYSLKIKATLTSLSNDRPAAGRRLTVSSNRREDTVTASSPTTGADGCLMLTLESRHKGELKLTVAETDISYMPLALSLKDAWYENTFLITGYHVCDEGDFSGPPVDANGLTAQHREDFLYGARGVIMQGTGKAINGQYVRPIKVASNWVKNKAGNPVRIANSSAVSFSYTSTVQGAFGAVSADHSIAVDPHIIPPRAQVEIDSIGLRHADDRGSQIVEYHIDNFLGSGEAVVRAWGRSGVNKTQRRVKFKG